MCLIYCLFFFFLGPSNQALFKSLKVTVDSPFFYRNEKKIFALYDVPHLFKSVRNNLKKYNIKFKDLKSDKVRTASWEDIKNFFIMDSVEKYRIAPKITKMHIYGAGLSSMKVSLATQIFSHSVAAGLCVLHKMNQQKKKEERCSTALHTAKFIGKMDKIFDSLNSKSRFSAKKYARAVSNEADDEVNHPEKWQKWAKWIDSWQFIKEKGTVRMPCQKGLIQTLNASIGIWNALKSDISFLMTSRFNQDCIENVFSSVRRRGGFRDNPSTFHFRSAIRNIIVYHFMNKKKSKNCEDDKDEVLIDLSKSSTNTLLSITENDENIGIEENDGEEVPTVGEMEQNVVAYICGVLAKSLLKKSPCEGCKNLLVGPKLLNTHTLLLYFKEYKDVPHGLHWPTDAYFNYMLQLSGKFHENINSCFHRPNIRKNLCSKLEKVNFNFFNHHHHHNEVKTALVHSYVTMMIRHTIKIHNDDHCRIDNSKRMKYVQHL